MQRTPQRPAKRWPCPRGRRCKRLILSRQRRCPRRRQCRRFARPWRQRTCPRGWELANDREPSEEKTPRNRPARSSGRCNSAKKLDDDDSTTRINSETHQLRQVPELRYCPAGHEVADPEPQATAPVTPPLYGHCTSRSKARHCAQRSSGAESREFGKTASISTLRPRGKPKIRTWPHCDWPVWDWNVNSGHCQQQRTNPNTRIRPRRMKRAREAFRTA